MCTYTQSLRRYLDLSFFSVFFFSLLSYLHVSVWHHGVCVPLQRKIPISKDGWWWANNFFVWIHFYFRVCTFFFIAITISFANHFQIKSERLISLSTILILFIIIRSNLCSIRFSANCCQELWYLDTLTDGRRLAKETERSKTPKIRCSNHTTIELNVTVEMYAAKSTTYAHAHVRSDSNWFFLPQVTAGTYEIGVARLVHISEFR